MNRDTRTDEEKAEAEPLTADERETLRDAAYYDRLTREHVSLIHKLINELDDDNCACAAVVMRTLLGATWLTAGRDGRGLVFVMGKSAAAGARVTVDEHGHLVPMVAK